MIRPGAAALVVALALGGCSPSESTDQVTVFAAASLRGTFTELAQQYEREHDVDVVLSFGGSSELAAQIVEGAPADVFASADERTMGTVVDAGLTAGPSAIFATNTLAVVVPADNPGAVRSVRDLASVDTVVCAPQVPCGAATRELFERAGVTVRPVSEEQSVTDVLGKVRSGQTDAGVVYVTDARAAAGDVTVIADPIAARVENRYRVAVLDRARDDEAARDFVAFVRGETGRSVLADAGFGPP